VDEENNYYVIYNELESKSTIAQQCRLSSNFTFIHCSSPPYSLREQLELPTLISQYKCRIFHSPHLMIPLTLQSVKRIITVHDLIPLIFHKYLPAKSKVRRYMFFYKRYISHLAHYADHIITDSYNSAKDICSLLLIPPKKISIIYPANTPDFSPGKTNTKKKKEYLAKEWGIKKPYLLFVGRQDYNKNLRTVVEAFLALRRRGEDIMLVLVTQSGDYFRRLEGILSEEDVLRDVVVTGDIPLFVLLTLYRGATALLIPSLYEGFGLPALEAMACGTPVISSRLTSLPEVVGSAGIYVDAEREDQIAEAVVRLLKDKKYSQSLAQAGIERAKGFSWEESARKTVEVYRRVAEQ